MIIWDNAIWKSSPEFQNFLILLIKFGYPRSIIQQKFIWNQSLKKQFTVTERFQNESETRWFTVNIAYVDFAHVQTPESLDKF